MKTSRQTQINLRPLEGEIFAEDDVKAVLEGYVEVLDLFVPRRHHVGDGVVEDG